MKPKLLIPVVIVFLSAFTISIYFSTNTERANVSSAIQPEENQKNLQPEMGDNDFIFGLFDKYLFIPSVK